ncbi:hypothetical protein AYI69_g4306 [Smittium culicis]|uniref:Uncharacterized protein n=1 Tax=Smittium culicis TaxID=133412 RepID=A0A1R1YEU7_9FUNG|nr:hypothetical protein AYI69_g4306 [Smittium culicis]
MLRKVSNYYIRFPDYKSFGQKSLEHSCSTSENGDTRSRKRKISTLQQQGVVTDSLEDQRSILKAQSFTDNAFGIIVANQSSSKRRYRYYTTQIKFLEWNIDNTGGFHIQASRIFDYLAEIFVANKLRVNTIKA